METKRCPSCHKILRADARICSRCRYAFIQQKSRVANSPSQRTIPPASPHRAGHYSGLHPEDQPYQSSMLMIQRPPVKDEGVRRLPVQEPERIVLPAVDVLPDFIPDEQDVNQYTLKEPLPEIQVEDEKVSARWSSRPFKASK